MYKNNFEFQMNDMLYDFMVLSFKWVEPLISSLYLIWNLEQLHFFGFDINKKELFCNIGTSATFWHHSVQVDLPLKFALLCP